MEFIVVTPVHVEPGAGHVISNNQLVISIQVTWLPAAEVWAGSKEEAPTPYDDWMVVEVMTGL